MGNDDKNNEKSNSDINKEDSYPEEIKKLPPQYRKLIMQASEYSGPFPPPQFLKELETILQGITERFMKMHEKEQDFRHEREIKIIRIVDKGATFGRFFSFSLSIFLISMGFVLALDNQNITSIAFVSYGGLGFISKIIDMILNRNED